MRRIVAFASAGLAGAATLTLLNELVLRIDRKSAWHNHRAQNALKSVLRPVELHASSKYPWHDLSPSSLLLNSALYSLLFAGGSKLWLRGALGGAVIGGAAALSRPAPASRARVCRRAEALSIATHCSAGLVASAIYSMVAMRRPKLTCTQSLPIDRSAL
jgi:hypothetical protein